MYHARSRSPNLAQPCCLRSGHAAYASWPPSIHQSTHPTIPSPQPVSFSYSLIHQLINSQTAFPAPTFQCSPLSTNLSPLEGLWPQCAFARNWKLCTSRQPTFPTGPFRHSAFLLQPFPHFGVAFPGLKAPARGWTGNGSANGTASFQRTATTAASLRGEAPHIIQPRATPREPRPTSPQRAESPAQIARAPFSHEPAPTPPNSPIPRLNLSAQTKSSARACWRRPEPAKHLRRPKAQPSPHGGRGVLACAQKQSSHPLSSLPLRSYVAEQEHRQEATLALQEEAPPPRARSRRIRCRHSLLADIRVQA